MLCCSMSWQAGDVERSMAKKAKPTIVLSDQRSPGKPCLLYTYRGMIERGARYEWRQGYSRTINGCIAYPWMTKRECQHDAKLQGHRAVFQLPNDKE
jgi:hypothetical protein